LFGAAAVFFLVLVMLPVSNYPGKNFDEPEKEKKFSIDNHDIIMILLLTIISLRSVIWNVFQLLHENNYEWLIAIATAAAAGKIAGGWLADKIGWRLYVLISLTAATPLLTLFKKELILFCIGVGLLQSGIPATTSLLIHSMRGKTERAIGLSFGTAIIAGAFVFYIPARDFFLSDIVLCSITVVMLSILFFTGKSKFSDITPG
jgi:MFS family permease